MRNLGIAILLIVSALPASAQDPSGLARFRAQVDGKQLHPGDRILVEDGANGVSPRAEIVSVLPGGAYEVKVWDKADAAPGDPEPWLKRANEREVVLSQADVAKLNGVVNPGGPYWLNTWLVDPASDPVLADRIAKARAAVAEILPAKELELPADPAARSAKLDEIAALQQKLIERVFSENPMRQPRRDPLAVERRDKVVAARPE